MIDLNFEPIPQCITYWKRRKLTPIGRISRKITLYSNFNTLTSPKADIIKHLNETPFIFVWDGRAKIKQTIFMKGMRKGVIRY